MRKSALIIFIFFLSVAQSLAVEIKGEVLNIEGNPVAEAVVLHPQSGNKSLTDEKGLFNLTVPDQEKIRLEIIHPDYWEQKIVLTQKDFHKKVIVRLIPYIAQRQEIVVTALRYPESSARVPAAETVVSKETIEEELAPNITEGLSNVPGVSSIGAGGFSLVPNIRGLARRRVLIMIDNTRVTSDRRTGPNASFVDPRDIERIEVLRSPSSVFYGSDAIGGVIHIITKKPPMDERLRGKINVKYGAINQEKSLGFSLSANKKKNGFYFSFQGNDAENYSSPAGEILQSQFSQGSLFGKISHVTEKREIHLSLLGTRGYDIGKANNDSDINPTWYPKENQNLIQFHWLEKKVGRGGELDFQAYLNPNFLETIKEKKEDNRTTKKSYSKIQSLNFGAHLSFRQKIRDNLRLTGGTDFYGRFSVKANNKYTYFTLTGDIEEASEEWPFTEGDRKDLGLFISADYTGVKNLDLVGGLRWDFIQMKALPGDVPPSQKSHKNAWTGFLGASYKLSEEIVAFANISRAYRVPSLSELFYTGITGRGSIIAQPDLKPETSFNLDGGIKFIFKRFFAGFYAFYYEIDDLIERFLVEEKLYTYGNIDKGRISGYELEMEYYPVPGWKIFGNFFSLKGKSLRTETSLNDIPPARLFLGTKVWVNHFSAEINSVFQWRKKEAGPAEIEIPGFGIANIKAGYRIGSSIQLYFTLSNFLNKEYMARPDPDGVFEPGRNFILGLSYSF